MGYSLWGHKESDTAEQLTLSLALGTEIPHASGQRSPRATTREARVPQQTPITTGKKKRQVRVLQHLREGLLDISGKQKPEVDAL